MQYEDTHRDTLLAEIALLVTQLVESNGDMPMVIDELVGDISTQRLAEMKGTLRRVMYSFGIGRGCC